MKSCLINTYRRLGVIVEQVFCVLKGRFRILLKRMDIDLENTVKTIITCCVLHNIYQLSGDFYIDANALRDILADYVERMVNN